MKPEQAKELVGRRALICPGVGSTPVSCHVLEVALSGLWMHVDYEDCGNRTWLGVEATLLIEALPEHSAADEDDECAHVVYSSEQPTRDTEACVIHCLGCGRIWVTDKDIGWENCPKCGVELHPGRRKIIVGQQLWLADGFIAAVAGTAFAQKAEDHD